MVCITRVKLDTLVKFEIFTCLWLLLKEQSGIIPFGVNTSINYHERKEIKYKMLIDILTKPYILTQWCHAHHGVKISYFYHL